MIGNISADCVCAAVFYISLFPSFIIFDSMHFISIYPTYRSRNRVPIFYTRGTGSKTRLNAKFCRKISGIFSKNFCFVEREREIFSFEWFSSNFLFNRNNELQFLIFERDRNIYIYYFVKILNSSSKNYRILRRIWRKTRRVLRMSSIRWKCIFWQITFFLSFF